MQLNSEERRATLRGLDAVHVTVGEPDATALHLGFKSLETKSRIDELLHDAGIHAVEEESCRSQPLDSGFLVLKLATRSTADFGIPVLAYSLRLNVLQTAVLGRELQKGSLMASWTETWNWSTFGTSLESGFAERIAAVVSEMVKEFISDYSQANP